MQTECIPSGVGLDRVSGRQVVAGFDGGEITSDAGALLLGRVDQSIGLIDRLTACFGDARDPSMIEHSLRSLVLQRVVGLALGYEDLVDHDQLRHDPVMAVLAGKLEARRRDCAPLAGKSTLNRLEHAPATEAQKRYRKISHDPKAIESLFVELFLDAHAEAPESITLDLDATDDPLHGQQEGRFFHGYYDAYCYLPLYVFCGKHLLVAKLRQSNIDGSAGSVEEIERVVAQIRARWPKVSITLRGDGGFARDALMTWCEANAVHYVFGLAKNARLIAEISDQQAVALQRSTESGKSEREFRDFEYRTRSSWSCARRVVGKAEQLPGRSNPRFVVTTLTADQFDMRALYEDLYCARGDMENRIKECQADLFADRTSAATMHANQLRLWLSSFAYVLLDALRRKALFGTKLAQATCGTLRLRLLKIGAWVVHSVRRVRIAMASNCPARELWMLAYARLAPDG